MDEQKPRDVFLFEQDGAYVVRLHVAGQAGSHHMLAEFTKDDINALVRQGPTLRVAGQTGSGITNVASATASPAAAPTAAAPVAAASTEGEPPGPPPADSPGWGSPTG